MTRRPYLLIEGFIAVAILVVLLLVMIPKWQRAQVSGRAAQALKDMAALAQAIEAYNLAFEGPKISGMIVTNQSSFHDPSLHYTVGTSFLNYDQENRLVGITFSTQGVGSDLTSHLPGWKAPIPIPMDTLELSSQMNTPGQYDLADPHFRLRSCDHLFDFVIRNPRGMPTLPDLIRNNLVWSCFLETDSSSEWVGIYHGPYLDMTREIQTVDDLRFFYSPYNPTNGVFSHGVTVFDAKKPISETSQFLLERYEETRMRRQEIAERARQASGGMPNGILGQ